MRGVRVLRVSFGFSFGARFGQKFWTRKRPIPARGPAFEDVSVSRRFLVFSGLRGDAVAGGPGPRIGEPVREDFLLFGVEALRFDRLVDHLFEAEHFVADDGFLLEELFRLVDAEARDGEAVGDEGAFGLQGFDGGEERKPRRDVVFDDEDALAPSRRRLLMRLLSP